MSNTVVAIVYSQIMKDVVNSVQKDFEDNGIDLSVLQDLEKMWESRVANTNVANFDHMGAQNFAQGSQSMSLDIDNHPGNGQQSITIPGVEEYASFYEQSYAHDLSAMGYNPMMMAPPGGQYAAANLASLASHHSMSGMPSNQLPSTSSLVSGSNSNQNMVSNSHYAQHYQHSHQAQMANYGGHLHSEYPSYSLSSLTHQDVYNNGVNSNSEYSLGNGTDPYRPTGPPQLDGTSDSFEASAKQITRQKADSWLESRILDKKPKPIPQVDGEDDDLDNDNELDAKLEDNDEDAINSDLDDSDEGEAEDAEKDGVEHIILCQYDKVSRTKNRWRCNLKDGIILVNGKDYLFSKATGEFQW